MFMIQCGKHYTEEKRRLSKSYCGAQQVNLSDRFNYSAKKYQGDVNLFGTYRGRRKKSLSKLVSVTLTDI